MDKDREVDVTANNHSNLSSGYSWWRTWLEAPTQADTEVLQSWFGKAGHT